MNTPASTTVPEHVPLVIPRCKPNGKLVLALSDMPPERKIGSILLPGQMNDNTHEAIILVIGDDVDNPHCKPGQRILVNKVVGNRIWVDGQYLQLFRDEDILLFLEDGAVTKNATQVALDKGDAVVLETDAPRIITPDRASVIPGKIP